MLDFYPLLKDFVVAIWTLGVGIVGYGVWIMRGIRQELHTLSQGLLKLEVQREAHEQQDNERHERLTRDIDTINAQLRLVPRREPA